MTSTSSKASKASAAASEPLPTEDKDDTATAKGAVEASQNVPDPAPANAPAETEAPAAGDLQVEPPLDKAPDAVPAAAPAEEERPKNHVLVVLAHPIDKERDLTMLRLKPKTGGYKVNEEIWVHPDSARTLITGGYAKGIHPEDRAAVEAALASASTAPEKA